MLTGMDVQPTPHASFKLLLMLLERHPANFTLQTDRLTATVELERSAAKRCCDAYGRIRGVGASIGSPRLNEVAGLDGLEADG